MQQPTAAIRPFITNCCSFDNGCYSKCYVEAIRTRPFCLLGLKCNQPQTSLISLLSSTGRFLTWFGWLHLIETVPPHDKQKRHKETIILQVTVFSLCIVTRQSHLYL